MINLSRNHSLTVTALVALALPVLLTVGGCGTTSVKTVTTSSKSSAETGDKGGSAPAASDATGSLSNLPEALRHDAAAYYGVGNPEPIDMEIVTSTETGINSGTQTMRLKETKDGVAIFAVERTGNLAAQLGAMEVRVEKDGVYVHSSGIAIVGDRDLELPADLAPGKTWSTNTRVDKEGQQMDLKNTFKVEGIEPVSTKRAKYPEALLVSSVGEGTLNKDRVRIETRSWFVKGRGNIKTEMRLIDAANKARTISIEESN
ncbi:MAG: hypothetical protein SFX74_10230 [Fimbriimonadaceae bacterium]|nr:hypothetical protein [Fimbriimonadaceae bacterium]